ncbi:hypothetical protein OROHE_015183 [Orobanche hederae]
MAWILFFKIRPSQDILEIRDDTHLEAEEILTYIKNPRNGSVWHFYRKLYVPSNVVQKKRVARILFFKIRPSQEILKIRDGTPLEAEEILTYIKNPRNGSVWHFSGNLYVPSNVVQKKRVARILFFKIRPSQEILKIRDGTPLEAEEILKYIKNPRNGSVWHFSGNLYVPSNVVQKKRVARILFFKIRPSQDILEIRDDTHLEAEEILTYIKNPRNGSVWHFYRKLYVPSNVVQKKRVARILFFKIRPSQEILKIRDGTPLEAEEILTYIKNPRNGSVWHFSGNLYVPSNVVQKKRVARILFFKIRPSQEILKIHDEILKIRDGTPLEAEEILTYIKNPRNGSVWHFSGNLYVPSNVVQKKRVARILFFKIRPSQDILKIRDGTPLEAEEILTYIKNPRNGSVWHFYSKLYVPSNVVQKKRVARILFFKIRPSQEILKIRDGTPLEAEEILTYIKNPRNGSVWHFSTKPSQEILKIRDGTPLEAEEILTYIKNPRNGSVWHFSGNLYVPSNVVQKKRVARILFFKIRPSQEILKIHDGTPLEKRVARILFFKIRPSQEILKIRDGTPLEAEEILTYIKNPRNGLVWHFSSKLYVPSNVVQKKRVARILFFKIRPSQEILKIRDGTPLEAEEILTYIKNPRNGSVWHFSTKPSQDILEIRDDTHLEAEEILTYIKNPRNGSVWHFYRKLYVPNNVVQKKRVARILFFKIRPSQEILKIRDGTPLEAEEILTYIKNPRNGSVWHFSGNLYVPSNVVQKKRVARILFFKIRPSQEILKIRDGTPLEAEEILTYIKNPRNGSVWHFSGNLYVPSNVVQKKRVARILFFKIRPSQDILEIRDDTHLEAEEILTYIKNPRNGSVWHFYRKLYVPSNVVQKKRVARILFFKIRPSQEILKIRDGTPLEAEEILTYIKNPRNGSVWHFSGNLYVPSNVVQKKRVARILFFKIRPSQEILKIHDEILKIRDGTPLEAEEILTYIKNPRNGSVWHFSGNLYVPSNVVQKKRVARILFFKIRPSQDILKIRDGTPLEAEEILTYIKNPRNGSVWHFYSKLYVPSNVVQKKRVARILFFKIRPSQEILKIRDGTPLEAEEILTYIKNPRNGSVWHFSTKPSQEILKIRDGTPLEAEEILTYIKNPRNGSVWHFSGNLYVPSNVVQKKRVARILFFKIRPSQEILKIHDGTPLEVEEILTYIKKPSKRIEILKIRDGTPLEAEEILTYIKNPRNGLVWHFSSKLYVPSNVVQKKRVARILFFKIRPSQEILKIRDGTPLEAEEILTYIKNPRNGSVWHFSTKLYVPNILEIRDDTHLEAEEILTYIKNPRNGSVWHFYRKLYVPSNVVQKKRVARILFFKIRPSQEILKIRDGPLEKKRVAWILFFKIRPSQDILEIRDDTHLEAEEILTYIKNPRNGSVWHFYRKLYVPSNVVQKKRVARILFFKIRPSQEILKIRDGTPLEAEEILTYIKNPRNGSVWHFSGNLYVPSNVVQKKRVARILFFKIRPSQEILKIRDGTPLEAEEILTYIKNPRNGSVWHFSGNLYVPSNVVQKKRVARILFFKIRPSQDILEIRDDTHLEAEEILTYIKNPRNGSVWHFYRKLYVPSNVVQKKRVARILFFKIRPSQEILKIRDGTPLEAEEILTYIKNPRNESVWHFSGNLYVPSNVVQKKRVARILFFKIRPSQDILEIRDDTHLEAEEILTYIKNPRNGSVWHFYRKLYVPSNVLQKKRVARIMFFKIRPSQEILKIRDGTPLEAEEILTYIKNPRNGSVWHFSGNLYVPSNVVQKKRVARILFFKIRPSQEILKIRDGPLEAEEILTYIKNPRNGSVWHFSTKLYVPSNVV